MVEHCPKILASEKKATTTTNTRVKTPFYGPYLCTIRLMRLMRSLVTSVFLYACESWILTAEPQARIQATKNEVLPQDTMHLL